MHATLEFLKQSGPDEHAELIMVPMRDGVRLATDIYLPKTGTGPYPAVLIRLPYDKTGRYTFIPQIAGHFAANGFAVIAQDVRGKYLSEGERSPFINEAHDGWDTAEWIISQPWSNGNIGTWGDSYYGFTQWALASTKHPAHKAMVPRVTGHRFLDMSPGGGMPTLTLLDWLVDAWSHPELVMENATNHQILPAIEMVNKGLPEGDAVLRRWLDKLKNPQELVDEVFPDGNPAERLSIPALHTGGWFDNLQFWQLDDWESALLSPAAEHQFLMMTTSDHEDYRWRPRGTKLDADFGLDPQALSEHLHSLLARPIAFFNHYLRGGTGPWTGPRVSYDVCGAESQTAASWPPAGTTKTNFGLWSDGSLRAGALAPASTLSWIHDPQDPVRYLVDSEWDQNRAGVPDESALCARDDTLCFDTTSLTEPLRLAGRCTLRAKISAPTTNTHLVVRLYDVDASGDARLLSGNAFEVVADGTTEFAVRLGDVAYVLPAGHRLRLLVATSLAGQYVIHPGTNEDPWLSTTQQVAKQTLHLDGAELEMTVEGP